ncbi:MAG TPA: hypothetical protein VMT85_07565 [Thermoanaerobaculia bacterium]|nr:hypothetical protein [Thermoanaerobaculia bacterium]
MTNSPDSPDRPSAETGERASAEQCERFGAEQCERFGAQVEALLFDTALDPVEDGPRQRVRAVDEQLEAHLGACTACAELLALHAELIAWEDAQPAPTELEEARLRHRVRSALAGERPSGRSSELSGGHGPTLHRTLGRRLALAAAVVLAVAGAFIAGRLWSGAQGSPRALADLPGAAPAGAMEDGDFAASLLHRIAASLRSWSSNDPQRVLSSAPFSFDNVQLRDLGHDRVRLGFDYSIHLEVERPRTDPLVTEVLVHAILDGGSLGTQLKAIGVAEGPALSPRLRSALIRTMLHDESAPARQAALERLLPDAALADVESALLEVLEHEPSVHMRLLAIDALAAGGVPPGRLEQAIEVGPAEPGQAVRLRVGNLQHGL